MSAMTARTSPLARTMAIAVMNQAKVSRKTAKTNNHFWNVPPRFRRSRFLRQVLRTR